MNRPSLRTIAQQAGVSVSSVSNAYNRPDQLSDAVRERILTTARELGYAGPNAAARALRTRHVGAVGMLFSTPLEYAFSDPYCVELLRGISEVMAEHRTHLVLIPQATAYAAHSAVVDAVIADGLDERAPAVQAILDRNLPTALSTDNSVGSAVYVDDYAAGELIGQHLAAQGHRHVTVVVGTQSPAGEFTTDVDPDGLYPYSRLRLAGITAGLGSDGTVTAMGVGGNSLDSGFAAAQAVLASGSESTAIAADSDVLASGVIKALERHGLRPGSDVAVTGFDDIPLAAQANLTTVRQPIRHKGRLLAQSLLDPEGTAQTTRLEGVLVTRGSTAPAKYKATTQATPASPDAPASEPNSTTTNGPTSATAPPHPWHIDELDLQAYLGRVGFQGRPTKDFATLRALHRAHVGTIPFENLELMLGRPIHVSLSAIQHKLVYRQRGGYCYEQNLLMAAVLERLGLPVERWLARVGDPTEGARPRSHLIVTTEVAGVRYLVDVGFGSGLLEPIELEPGGAISQGVWTFEVTRAPDGLWHLRELRAGKWTTRYTFMEEQVFPIDVEGANHLTSTTAKSPFTQRPILVGRSESLEKALIGRELSIADAERDLSRGPVSDEDLGAALEEHFDLRLSQEELVTLASNLE